MAAMPEKVVDWCLLKLLSKYGDEQKIRKLFEQQGRDVSRIWLKVNYGGRYCSFNAWPEDYDGPVWIETRPQCMVIRCIGTGDCTMMTWPDAERRLWELLTGNEKMRMDL